MSEVIQNNFIALLSASMCGHHQEIALSESMPQFINNETSVGCHRCLSEEIERLNSLLLDKPDDRLYHAADKTWWRKDSDGTLKRAEPPAEYDKEKP